ncbi:Post-GPI attachment to proteins factor 3 [Schistosoma japonicum]|nr:Post-GPI attachment to proteins factor 3 [Schistosoma japonicum]
MAAIYFKVVLTYVCGLLFVIPPVITSIGDQAYVFYKCNQKCIEGICESSPNKRSCWDKHFNSSSVVMFEHTILWDCKSECRYRCMWNTVSAFEKDGLPVPQFNGKWPFVRLCGMQEPASVLFSLLNLVFICYMFSQFYKYVPFNSPMYKTWVVQTVFSMNAWVWSIIFHSRDTSFTEKMDYFSALAFVIVSVIVLHRRIFNPNRLVTILFSAILIAVFVRHVNYMTFVKFDYGYNLTVNVLFGLINCFGWLFFSIYLCDYKKQPYIIYCWLSVTCLSVFMLLELCDFVPIGWIFDSHALWHASSILIIIPWYKFIIADCLYLLEHNSSGIKVRVN